MHKTAEELAALYAGAATADHLAMAWISTTPDRRELLFKAPDQYLVAAEAHTTRWMQFHMLTGIEGRGA